MFITPFIAAALLVAPTINVSSDEDELDTILKFAAPEVCDLAHRAVVIEGMTPEEFLEDALDSMESEGWPEDSGNQMFLAGIVYGCALAVEDDA